MKQNVFMTSMYFFAPLQRVDEEILSQLSFREKEYNYDVFKNIECGLSIAVLEEHMPFTLYYKNEHSQHVEKKVKLNAYLLKYNYTKYQEESYIMSFGTSVDKIFEQPNQGDSFDISQLLTEKDIIKLKWTFITTGKHGQNDFGGEKLCLLHETKDLSITHVEWLEQLLSRYNFHLQDADLFYYSVIDVCGVNIDIKNNSFAELHRIFSDTFYLDDNNDYKQELGTNCDKFAFGLMIPDDYYEKFTSEIISPFTAHSYYLKTFERMFISRNGTVNIKTRCPYKSPDQKPICRFDNSFTDVFFPLEFCTALYNIVRLKSIKEKLKSNEFVTLKQGQVELSQVENENVFNLEASRQRMECLFKAMGIYEEIDNLSNPSKMKAELLEMVDRKTDKNSQTKLTYLSLLMVILQILIALWGLLKLDDPFDLTFHTLILLLISSLLVIFLSSMVLLIMGKDQIRINKFFTNIVK